MPGDPLHIEMFCLGPWMTNCYVVSVGEGGACWIVDAGFEPQPMIDCIRRRQLHPSRLVLTHAHVDHIAGVSEIRELWPDLPILIHEAERRYPSDPQLNLSAMLAEPVVAPEPTGTLTDGQTLELNDATFEVMHTPGHSPGGICLYCEAHDVAIVGDTLFAGSIGRYDFPTSNGRELMQSIRERLLALPDETRILPGHGPETTIDRERKTNPYLTS